MSKGLNKVQIIGNLGAAPEMRAMPDGTAVTNLSIATTDVWKDKQTGEKKERTEWHRVVFIGRLAEIAGQYLQTGSKVYVEGALRTRKWTDQSGVDRFTTEVRCFEMQMLDSRASQPQGSYTPTAAQPQQSGGVVAGAAAGGNNLPFMRLGSFGE